jgi:hypothetical protein
LPIRHIRRKSPDGSRTGCSSRWTVERSRSYCHKIERSSFFAGYAVSFQITVLKVLVGHPQGRASLADLTRYVSLLISSGSDWTNRTKRLAARAPNLDIFGDSFVLRDDNGWHITEAGRQFLASLEQERSEAMVSTAPPLPERSPLRLVVSNGRLPRGVPRTSQSPLAKPNGLLLAR